MAADITDMGTGESPPPGPAALRATPLHLYKATRNVCGNSFCNLLGRGSVFCAPLGNKRGLWIFGPIPPSPHPHLLYLGILDHISLTLISGKWYPVWLKFLIDGRFGWLEDGTPGHRPLPTRPRVEHRRRGQQKQVCKKKLRI